MSALDQIAAQGDAVATSVDDVASSEPLIELPAIEPAAVARLRRELGVTGLTAQVLARRGHALPSAARDFIDGGELHAANELPGVTDAVALLRRHLEAGSRIGVHGDYDADGVCSTVLLVESLAALGADVTWHVPDRFADGYGLGHAALERFVDDGVSLVIAVDCGITAVDEAAWLAQAGAELLIVDHHQPGDALPAATIVHPGLTGDYATPQMCASAVAWKLMWALYESLAADTGRLAGAVELAGLATVTDVMPLRGENRTLVRRAVEAIRCTDRPGLRELMRAAAVDPLRVDASTFGFRLGPRLNAAGRMRSAEAAVELLLTTSEQRAATLAEELGGMNAFRQEVERELMLPADQQARAQLDQFAIVVAGEDWHKGVLGIVAGKLAERYRRPCIALAIEDGVAGGSGRSGGRYDLLAGLQSCASVLLTFGGHRAAAGLTLDAARIEEFRAALQADAGERLTADDLRPRFTADAVVDATALTLDAAEELALLGPFGNENPEPTIVIPAAQIELSERMGDAKQHARLSLRAGGGRTRAVAFDWQNVKPAGESPYSGHAVTRLSRNEWRGAVEAQVQVRAIAATEPIAVAQSTAASWSDLFAHEFDAELTAVSGVGDAASELLARAAGRIGESPAAPLLELVAAGRPVAVVVRDARPWPAAIDRLTTLAADSLRELRVVEYDALPDSTELSDDCVLLLADPPLYANEFDFLGRQDGEIVLAWGERAITRAQSTIGARACERKYVTEFWRLLDAETGRTSAELENAGRDAGLTWLDAIAAARMARVLKEAGLLQLINSGSDAETVIRFSAVRDVRSALDQSRAFRSYSETGRLATECLIKLTNTS